MSLSVDEIQVMADQLVQTEHFHDRFNQLVNVARVHMTPAANDRFFKLLGLHGKAQALLGGIDTLANMEHHFDDTSQLFLRRYVDQWSRMTAHELMILYLGAAESYNMLNSSSYRLPTVARMEVMYQCRVWIDMMYMVVLFPNHQLVLQNRIKDGGSLDVVDVDVQQQTARKKLI